MKIVVAICCFLLALPCIAQIDRTPAGIRWVKSLSSPQFYSVSGDVIDTLPSGNVLVASTANNYNEHGILLNCLTRDGHQLWQKFHPASVQRIKDMQVLPDGGIVMVGDGTLSGGRGVQTDSSVWIHRYSATGEKQWGRYLHIDTVENGEQYLKYVNAVAVAADGSIYATGVNFFEGPDFTTDSTTGWLTRIKPDGVLDWMKHYVQENGEIKFSDLTVGWNDRLLVVGSSLRYNEYNNPGILFHFDRTTGDLIQEIDTIRSNNIAKSVDCIERVTDGYILAGVYHPSELFDNDSTIAWFRKLDTLGNVVWDKTFATGKTTMLYNVRKDPTGGYAAIAYTFPGYDSLYLGAVSLYRLDEEGNTVAVKQMKFEYLEEFKFGLLPIGDEQFLLSGRMEGTIINGQPLASYPTPGGADTLSSSIKVVLMKISLQNTIAGFVYYDKNDNGQRDEDEPFLENIKVQSSGPNFIAASTTNSAGAFTHYVYQGSYATKPVSDSPYFKTEPQLSEFGNWMQSDTIYLGINADAAITGVKVELEALSPARPGFIGEYLLRYKNIGTTTISYPYVILEADSRQFFRGATVLPALVDSEPPSDRVIWSIPSLTPFTSVTYIVYLENEPPPVLNNSDTLTLKASVASVLDEFETEVVLQQVVTGSFDPNDKMERNNGLFTESKFLQGEQLQYLIRFQNLGTDTAFTVEVRDTLDALLDWSTLDVVATSHPYEMQVRNGNAISWKFNNIQLPHAEVNEPESHGYILYRVKPKAAWKVGEAIHNTAAIYFDYNLPVVTNDAVTVLMANPDPLHISLLDFRGKYQNKKVLLNWTATSSEADEYFTVQRSVDGVHFQKLGTVRAEVGTSAYSWEDGDGDINGATRYYRLVLHHRGEGATYSNVLLFQDSEAQQKMEVYPNPLSGSNAFLKFFSNTTGAAYLSIYDQVGRTVIKQSIQLLKGQNSIVLSQLDRLPPGLYIISIHQGNTTISIKYQVLSR